MDKVHGLDVRTNRINWAGLLFAVALGTAGYCFGDKIGLGIASLIVAAVQLL